VENKNEEIIISMSVTTAQMQDKGIYGCKMCGSLYNKKKHNLKLKGFS